MGAALSKKVARRGKQREDWPALCRDSGLRMTLTHRTGRLAGAGEHRCSNIPEVMLYSTCIESLRSAIDTGWPLLGLPGGSSTVGCQLGGNVMSYECQPSPHHVVHEAEQAPCAADPNPPNRLVPCRHCEANAPVKGLSAGSGAHSQNQLSPQFHRTQELPMRDEAGTLQPMLRS